ncbi:MAG TPA: AarF/ABC1/UbiB kinase family protein [Acidimicrobiales bacterium]|nr:AarF/ABC1/UbiB kinase family protein [Acidimicrobiales bacterium]
MKRLLLLVVALAAGFAVATRRRTRRGDPFPSVMRTSQGRRNAQLAMVGTRLGATAATNKAKRVFAGAERREQLDAELELATAAEVTAALGNMKGALMKLGQMASYLDDGLPEPVREALRSLQADAPPMSSALAAEVVERELGQGPPDRAFAEWDPTPIAAASIGQVHRAMTHDGRAVAVKVQYPGVDEAIQADLDNSDFLARIMGMLFPGLEPGPLVEELRARLTEEVDYRLEADNQRHFADFYRRHPFIHIPDVVDELSTGRVLTTELAPGVRLREVVATWSREEQDLAGETIFRFVFRSLYRLHCFNGDPHPGNYLFEPGGRVTFLDFGLVKRFTPHEVHLFESMVRTIVLERDGDRFREILEGANVLKRGSGMSADEVLEWFGYFYEFVLRHEVKTFTHEYAAESVSKIFTRSGEVAKYGNVPPSFVLIQRINLGLSAVLAELGATANWRAIAEELWPMTSAPPSTSLGRAEADWLASTISEQR